MLGAGGSQKAIGRIVSPAKDVRFCALRKSEEYGRVWNLDERKKGAREDLFVNIEMRNSDWGKLMKI